MTRVALQKAVSSILDCTCSDAVSRLQLLLEVGAITHTSTCGSVERLLRPDVIPPNVLSALLSAWSGMPGEPLPPAGIALALAVAVEARRVLATGPCADLVWTGPWPPPGVLAQPTASVIIEMLSEARNQVLVVGYCVTTGSEPAIRVIQALAKARRRGCQVTIALHDDGTNHGRLTSVWPRSVPLPRLLRWCGRAGDPIASLHAKLVAVDDSDLLVTSANLTAHGLEANIEVGVRLHNQLALEVTRHFAALERQGVLVSVNPTISPEFP